MTSFNYLCKAPISKWSYWTSEQCMNLEEHNSIQNTENKGHLQETPTVNILYNSIRENAKHRSR